MDDLDLADAHGAGFEELAQRWDRVGGVDDVLLLENCSLELCFVHLFVI